MPHSISVQHAVNLTCINNTVHILHFPVRRRLLSLPKYDTNVSTSRNLHATFFYLARLTDSYHCLSATQDHLPLPHFYLLRDAQRPEFPTDLNPLPLHQSYANNRVSLFLLTTCVPKPKSNQKTKTCTHLFYVHPFVARITILRCI